MSIESVMPSDHLTLYFPLLLLSSIFPSIRGYFSMSQSSCQAKVLEFQLQHQSLQWIFKVDFLWDWLVWSLCSQRDSHVFSSTTVWKHQFLGAQPSLGFPGSSADKESAWIRETWVWSLGWEYPLEKEMATHCSILTWRIPWGPKDPTQLSLFFNHIQSVPYISV